MSSTAANNFNSVIRRHLSCFHPFIKGCDGDTVVVLLRDDKHRHANMDEL